MLMARRLLICTELSPQDLRHAAFSAATPRQARRMHAIANAIEGMARKEAARLADMSDQALVDAIKRYNAEGMDGLMDRPRSGRPSKLDAEQQKELCEIVLAGPDIEMDGLSAYTRDDVAAIAKTKWNVTCAVTTIGRLMRDGGLSRQKTRPSHPKKKPEAAAAFSKNAG
jgi:transposase